jgi:hypothetical protein
LKKEKKNLENFYGSKNYKDSYWKKIDKRMIKDDENSTIVVLI